MKGPRDRLSKISKPYALQLPGDNDDDNDDKEDDDQRNMSYNHLNHVATTKTNNQTNIAITLCVKRVIEFQHLGNPWAHDNFGASMCQF